MAVKAAHNTNDQLNLCVILYRGDRYMLLTFEEFPRNIKAGWKENLVTFMNELKNLDATGMTTLGSALKQVIYSLIDYSY